jgi:hypothetical protein
MVVFVDGGWRPPRGTPRRPERGLVAEPLAIGAQGIDDCSSARAGDEEPGLLRLEPAEAIVVPRGRPRPVEDGARGGEVDAVLEL